MSWSSFFLGLAAGAVAGFTLCTFAVAWYLGKGSKL